MSKLAFPSPHQQAITYPPSIALRELWPWTLFVGVLLLLVYFVGVDEGALSLTQGSFIHELVHDGRHLLGFPCH
jgi:Probable cobalt transporter subunit (CbtB)